MEEIFLIDRMAWRSEKLGWLMCERFRVQIRVGHVKSNNLKL